MKLPGIVSAASLVLLLGVTAPVNARQEPQEKQEKQEKQDQPAKAEKEERAKPEKQEEGKAPKQEQQAKPEKQQEAKAPKQEQAPKAEKQQQAKAPKQEQQAKPAEQKQAKGQQEPQRQQQAASTQRPQRTPQEETRQRAQPALRLSARGSGRISDARFRSNFGREHEFHVGNPVLVGGYSRFQYGGYWFGFVEPWPVGWYYTDDVYIDYVDGGYYMYNPYYPDTRFALTVVI
ncbi:MAG: cell envelope integrity protein TolA [Candidatus Acidiferrum sp.]